jgi:hypothetical protein
MSDRRSFLSLLGSSLSGIVAGDLAPRPALGVGALQVTAEPTVFWANPEGTRNLVRFVASGIGAPAGRLRVYDGARRLLGTAGMLQTGNALRGELWIPLERSTAVTSELEAPGVRGPFRTAHQLFPAKRWTIVWLTVVSPDDLIRELHGLSPINRAVQTAVWRESGVTANPMAAAWRLHQLDHRQFLQGADGSPDLERTAGIQRASAVLIDDEFGFPVTTPMALQGVGIRYVVRRNGAEPFAWWPAPDGSRVLTMTLPVGADPDSLGFGDAFDTMAMRVSAYLTRLTTDETLTVVAQTAVHDRLPHMATAVQEWNRKFAYPRILVGGTDSLAAGLEDLPLPDALQTVNPSVVPALPPDIPLAARLADERTAAGRNRMDSALWPLADLFGSGERIADPGGKIAQIIDTRVPGFIIANPSPFRRTDVATLPDGRLQPVTDVPALGYAFVLDEGLAAQWSTPDPAVSRIDGRDLSVWLDSRTGAIRSVRDRGGREWIGRGGFNATNDTILKSLSRLEYPGFATAFEAHRYSPYLGDFTSRVTAWKAFPWIDVENRVTDPAAEEFSYGFDPALSRRGTRWEIPAGHHETAADVPFLTHLRWIALDGDDGSILIRGLETPLVNLRANGRLEFRAPAGPSRYRFAVVTTHPSVAECAHFGWNAEPFETIAVPGNPAGSAPRYGTAIVLDQTDAALIAIEPSGDGSAITAFLQNLTDTRRVLTLGFGLLAWTSARKVDFRGADVGAVTEVPDGLAVQVAAWGVAAVRLTGMYVRE